MTSLSCVSRAVSPIGVRCRLQRIFYAGCNVHSKFFFSCLSSSNPPIVNSSEVHQLVRCDSMICLPIVASIVEGMWWSACECTNTASSARELYRTFLPGVCNVHLSDRVGIGGDYWFVGRSLCSHWLFS